MSPSILSCRQLYRLGLIACLSVGSLLLHAQTPILSDPGTTRGNTDAVVTDDYGPADISNCTSISFSVDYSFSLPWDNSGNMESADECNIGAGGCAGDPNDPQGNACSGCWDFLLVEYLVNGTEVFSELIGEDPTDDDEISGTITYDGHCTGAMPGTASIRISSQTWAGDEAVTYSNITILCYEGTPMPTANPDPVCATGTLNLDAGIADAGAIASSTWSGPGDIDDPSALMTTATNLTGPTATFTIMTTDVNGCDASADVTVDVSELVISPPSPVEICYSLIPFQVDVLNLSTIEDELRNFDPSLTVNWYFDMAGTDPLDWFDLGDLSRIVTNFITTVYASVSDGVCESNIVPVSVDLSEIPRPSNQQVDICPDASGQASYTLSDSDIDFNEGDFSQTVTYHDNLSDAENGVGEVTGTVTTAVDRTFFVRVETPNGCAGTAELLLQVTTPDPANNAMLLVCDSGFGDGDFDLTLADADVLGIATGTVTYYTDPGLSNEIFDPANFNSGPTTVYAVITDGDGCPSPPGEVLLELETIDESQVGLTLTPDTGCGETLVTVGLETPFDPPGDYSFEIEYEPVGGGPIIPITLVGQTGDQPFSISIDESYVFRILAVTGPAPNSCRIEFFPAPEYVVTISEGPMAFPATDEACADDLGEATFDLTTLNTTVNGGTAQSVNYFFDADATMPIPSPTAFTISSTTTVYGQVTDSGACAGETAPVTLTLHPRPAFDLIPTDVSCNGAMDGAILVDNLTGSPTHTFSWSPDQGNTDNPTALGPGNYTVTVTDANNCSASNSVTLDEPTALSLSCGEQSQATFGNSDGVASITISGGSPTYSYTLTGPDSRSDLGLSAGTFSISNLAPGDYRIDVTDANNCTNFCEFTITEATPGCDLQVMGTGTDISCNGAGDGSINLTITSSQSITTIDWSEDTYDGIEDPTGISVAGSYEVTVTDALGCMAGTTVVIAEPTALSLSCGEQSQASSGGTDGIASITISGASPPYSYTLSGLTTGNDSGLSAGTFSISNLAPGDYRIDVTDANNCTNFCEFTITEATPGCDLQVMGTGTDISCNGADDGSINLTITSSQSITTIDWSEDTYDGIEDPTGISVAGSYEVTVTDALGCMASTMVSIAEPTAISVDCSNTTNPSSPGGVDGSLMAMLNGGTPPYDVSWSGPVSGTQNGVAAGAFNLSNLPAGTYTINLTDANSCLGSCSFTLNDPGCDLLLDCRANGEGEGQGPGSYTFSFSGGMPVYQLTLAGPLDITFAQMNTDPYNSPVLPPGDWTFTVVDGGGCSQSCSFTIPDCSQLQAVLMATEESCAGSQDGLIDLDIFGGTAPYMLDWSVDSLDGPLALDTLVVDSLLAGMYSVTVTDAIGCETTAMVTLNAFPDPVTDCQVLQSPTNAGASDGSINVNITQGAPATYTIAYDNGAGTNGSLSGTLGNNAITGLPPGTYTITVTNTAACTASCMVELVPNACSFSLTPFAIAESCAGEADGQANVVAAGGQAPYSFLWNTGDTTAVIDSLLPGNYLVSVTDGNACTAEVTVIVDAGAPRPGLTVGAGAVICHDSCYALPLMISSTDFPVQVDYELIVGGIVEQRVQNFSSMDSELLICPEGDGIPEGDFQLRFVGVTNLATGCDSTLNELRSFRYNAPATSLLNPTLCFGDSLVVNLEVFNAANPNGTVTIPGAAVDGCDSLVTVDLSFYPENRVPFTSSICNGDTISVAGERFTAARLSGEVVLTDVNGCDSTIVVDLTLLELGVNNLSPTLCTGDSLTVAGEIFHAGRPTGTIRLTGQAANGCDSLINVELMPFLPPVVETFEFDICRTDTVNLGGQRFFAGNLSDTLVLDNAAFNGCDSILQVNLGLQDVAMEQLTLELCAGDSLTVGDSTLTMAGTFDILLPGTAAGGCDSLVQVDLTILPTAINNLTPTLCEGDSLVVAGQVFNAVNPSGSVLLPAAAANGCDSLVMLDLQFLPTLTGQLQQTLCAGDSLQVGDEWFDAARPSGSVLLAGAGSTGCDSLVNVDLVFLPGSLHNIDTVLCAGASLAVGDQLFSASRPSGIVVLEGAAASGCDSTVFVMTSYEEALTVSLSTDQTICPEESATVSLSFSPRGSYDFNLAISNGTTIEEMGWDGTQLYTVSLDALNTTTTVTLGNITHSSGCPVDVSVASTMVSVSELRIAISAENDGSVSCPGGKDGSLTVEVLTGLGPYDYRWSTGATDATVNSLAAGTYSVTVTDAAGCTRTDSFVLAEPLPLMILSRTEAVGCEGSSTGTIFLDSVAGGLGPYEYSLDGEFFSQASVFPQVIPNQLSGSYTLYVQDARDCVTEVDLVVPEGEALVLDLGDDETIELGDSVLLSPFYNFLPASWTWTPPVGITRPDSLITHANPTSSTLYRLEVVDSNGCRIADEIRINVDQRIPIYVPNAFSPNNDGRNDEFVIFGEGVEEIEHFQIFDRWGNQVYAAGGFLPNDPTYGWDGSLNGEPMNPAVFVYWIQLRLLSGETVQLEGEVLLLR